MLDKPKIGVTYVFVRTIGGKTEEATFVRWEDDSANIEFGGMGGIYECKEDAWKDAIADLEREGFRFARRNSN
jgi:hypothetical protein